MAERSSEGGEASLPATYGGPGFTLRATDHAADVAAGQLWRRVGGRSEWKRLREVALARPPQSLDDVQDPDVWHMLAVPDRERIGAELDALARLFAAEGVGVVRLGPAPSTPPNFLFLRDLVFTTPEGCVVGRPGSPVRAAEARVAQAGLAAMGVPLLGLPTGRATFEGADALWLDPQTVLLGTGRRTNTAGRDWLRGLLAPQGVEVIGVPLALGVQHLLGTVLRLDRDLAVVDRERLPPEARAALEDRGVELIELEPGAELREGRSMNGVTLGPRRVVLPAGNPRTEAALRDRGVVVRTSSMHACLAAAGAMGCMTAILRRDA
jgi:N-dimethylarginine dimethylaminohydrolase